MLTDSLMFVESEVSSDEVFSSSLVGSAVNERGVEFFDDVVWSVTKKHLGVLRGIVASSVMPLPDASQAPEISETFVYPIIT